MIREFLVASGQKSDD